MTRPLRVEFPGALYHVTARGDGRTAIFRDDDDRAWILSRFGGSGKEARRGYARFIARGKGVKAALPDAAGGFIVGGEAFLESVQSHLERKREVREHPRRERHAGRPPLTALLGRKGLKRDKAARDGAIREAYARHGYTLSEIGDFLGLHYSTISRIARAGEA